MKISLKYDKASPSYHLKLRKTRTLRQKGQNIYKKESVSYIEMPPASV